MAPNAPLRDGLARAARDEIRRRQGAGEEAADPVTELGRLTIEQATYGAQQALDRWHLRLMTRATATVSLIELGNGGWHSSDRRDV
jgi:hypothetical protein